MRELLPDIARLSDSAGAALAAKNAAREAGLSRSRDALRCSANAIRAVHRGEFDVAETLAAKAGQLLAEARLALADHPDILYAGFVHDAEKEFAEASVTIAILSGRKELPRPEELRVELAAY